MEQALNRRFASISLKIKDIDQLIEHLEKQKKTINDQIEKAIISKKQLEYDQRHILLKIEDCRKRKPQTSPLPSSILTPPKTPISCDIIISSSSVKCALDATFEKSKRSKTDEDIPSEDIPDEDLLEFADRIATNESNDNTNKEHKTEINESKDDDQTKSDCPQTV